MFTGLVEETGKIERIQKSDSGARVYIKANKICDCQIGDSVSVNGTCLTVVENSSCLLAFDLLQETLKRSSIGSLRRGDLVNLERALKADGRLGGHFVTGHIDALLTISSVKDIGTTKEIRFKVPDEFSRFIVNKGSIAIDGISLTVGDIDKDSLVIYFIPHTLKNTTLGIKREADKVNVEFDILAKYVAKQTHPKRDSRVTQEFLSETGFI